MAQCTPDMKADRRRRLQAKGGKLILSDLFRSYQMQFDAHQDFVTGRKKANSPPPGGSLHEAGRAFGWTGAITSLPILGAARRSGWCRSSTSPVGAAPGISNAAAATSGSMILQPAGAFDKPYKAAAASASGR